MQPRSLPCRISVTKRGADLVQEGVVFAGVEAQPEDVADGRARDRDQHVARVRRRALCRSPG